MPVFRVVVKAVGNQSVQGIRFRELVEKMANDSTKPVWGQVRNLREKEAVEIQAIFDSEPAFRGFLGTIKQKAKLLLGVNIEWEEIISSEKPIFFENTFKAIREDDIKEMFWALNGAKREFEKVYVKAMLYEKKKELKRLKGLEKELNKLKYHLSTRPGEPISSHGLDASWQFLIEPFDEDLETILSELSSKIEANQEEKTKNQTAINEFVRKVDELIDKARIRVQELINNREAEIALFSGNEA